MQLACKSWHVRSLNRSLILLLQWLCCVYLSQLLWPHQAGWARLRWYLHRNSTDVHLSNTTVQSWRRLQVGLIMFVTSLSVCCCSCPACGMQPVVCKNTSVNNYACLHEASLAHTAAQPAAGFAPSRLLKAALQHTTTSLPGMASQATDTQLLEVALGLVNPNAL